MSQNAKKQEYQEIETMSHISTQPDNVIALPLQAQEDAREVQEDAIEVQPQSRPNFPLNMKELGKAFGVSRQAITPKFKAIAKLYREFGREHEVKSGDLCLEKGFEEIERYYQSPKPSLPKFEVELRDRLIEASKQTTQESLKPVMTSSAMVVSPQPDYGSAIAKMSQSIESLSQTQEQILQGLESMKDSQQNLNLMGAMAGASSAKQVLTHEMQSFMANYTQGKAELNNAMVNFLGAINNPQNREDENE